MNSEPPSKDAAEIARLVSETERLRAETEKLKAEREKMAAETSLKLQAEVEKLVEEGHQIRASTVKLMSETRWHPMVVVAGTAASTAALLGAAVGIFKMLSS